MILPWGEGGVGIFLRSCPALFDDFRIQTVTAEKHNGSYNGETQKLPETAQNGSPLMSQAAPSCCLNLHIIFLKYKCFLWSWSWEWYSFKKKKKSKSLFVTGETHLNAGGSGRGGVISICGSHAGAVVTVCFIQAQKGGASLRAFVELLCQEPAVVLILYLTVCWFPSMGACPGPVWCSMFCPEE